MGQRAALQLFFSWNNHLTLSASGTAAQKEWKVFLRGLSLTVRTDTGLEIRQALQEKLLRAPQENHKALGH